MTLSEIEAAEPVYETLPGWEGDLTTCRELRGSARTRRRRYVERVEALVEVPVELISIGPGRDETISRTDPFRPA